MGKVKNSKKELLKFIEDRPCMIVGAMQRLHDVLGNSYDIGIALSDVVLAMAEYEKVLSDQ